jgi:AcrR family transcriptional regulator
VTSTAADKASPRRKAGRPARISRAMIAEAAHELGLEGLTLKAVADHLGVSVAALYHHVSGKDDLLRIAAEESTRAIPLPVDRGQHWAQWLLEWANYNRAVFTAQPGLLGQYLEGAIQPESVVHNLDAILAVLVREGFTVPDANAAYELVSSCALGAVVGAKWEHAMARGEKDVGERYRRIVDATPTRQLIHVRRLLTTRQQRPTFDARIATVLRGIAVEHDLPWRPLVHDDGGQLG